MKTIVAPTDFSAISLNAVDYAADMACTIGAKLILLHVYTIPVPFSEVPMFTYSEQEMEDNAKAQLDRLNKTLSQRIGGRITIRNEVQAGNVVDVVAEYSDKIQPFAIVMGAESAGVMERFLFGGETLKSLRKLQWPLIVIPPMASFKGIRKIGFACDFAEVLESIRMKEIKAVVKEFNAELEVLHVREEIGRPFNAETIQESGSLQEMLMELDPSYHFINDSDIEKGINDFAEKNRLDLLIIIPKRHSLISHIFRHSHSKKVILHTHVPVMAIHEL